MAYRVITQVVFVGARVLGRSFAEAYRQAAASSSYQRANARTSGTSSSPSTSDRQNIVSGMTLDEAVQILNVKPPAATGAEKGLVDIEEVMDRFKRLFDANDPAKGGSFYLQSKILRARERLEADAKPYQEKVQEQEEVKSSWPPKMYK